MAENNSEVNSHLYLHASELDKSMVFDYSSSATDNEINFMAELAGREDIQNVSDDFRCFKNAEFILKEIFSASDSKKIFKAGYNKDETSTDFEKFKQEQSQLCNGESSPGQGGNIVQTG